MIKLALPPLTFAGQCPIKLLGTNDVGSAAGMLRLIPSNKPM